MNYSGYLISATLSGIIAQRLVRKICPKCKEKYVIANDSPECFILKNKISEGDIFYKGKGCEYCHGSGFYGRTPIHEFLRPSPAIRNEILKLTGVDEMLRIAKSEGFKTMREDGVEKARAGITTLEEIGRTLYVE